MIGINLNSCLSVDQDGATTVDKQILWLIYKHFINYKNIKNKNQLLKINKNH